MRSWVFFLPAGDGADNVVRKTLVTDAVNVAIRLVTDDVLARRFADFRRCYDDMNEANFGIGVGIACGWTNFGEIGAPWRREYTVIGKSVNVLSRVQGCAKGGEVLCTEDLVNHIDRARGPFELLAPSYGPEELKRRLKGFETTVLWRVRLRES